MHKHLIKKYGLLIVLSYFLWGALSAAYVSINSTLTLADNTHVLENTYQKSYIEEKGIHQVSLPLAFSWSGTFRPGESERSSKERHTHRFLHTAQHQTKLGTYTLRLIRASKAFEHITSRSIYLLDCALLI